MVPRDVVFGHFATVGGVKESWTVPLFILSADFADALPADEDPMPLDGNPHPLPGNLQPLNNNLFVNPQYPEIWWDAMQVDHNDGADNVQYSAVPVVQQVEVGEQEQESMVLNPSDNSGLLLIWWWILWSSNLRIQMLCRLILQMS